MKRATRGLREQRGVEGHQERREVGKCTGKKGCWDKSHYNINQRPGTERTVGMSLHWRSETPGGDGGERHFCKRMEEMSPKNKGNQCEESRESSDEMNKEEND